ncbi:MAG: tRNA pseudouridine(55) synthase TruB [Bacilli bacterium]
MDGIIIVDKPADFTSRDVVNKIGKIFHTKKVGHTGTLDPLATGVLVIALNKGTKIVELLTSVDKEYIAEFEFGTLTDTLDNTGNILSSENTNFSEYDILNTLKKCTGEYEQTVPIYSAVKINGKKLYEYARNNIPVELPKRLVNIKELELLDIKQKENKTVIKVRATVTKGTYIRSLGNDIASHLNTFAIMTNLRRTRQGNFKIEDAIKLEDINEFNKLKEIKECLTDYETIKTSVLFEETLLNGSIIDNIYNKKEVLFVDQNENPIALYKIYSKDETKMKPWKMFKIKS